MVPTLNPVAEGGVVWASVRSFVVGACVVMTMIATTSVGAADEVPPCFNDTHREEAGRVEVDLRPNPRDGGALTELTMWWFIDDPGVAAGTYNWNHIINGRATTAPHFDLKDDQLHTSLRMFERLVGQQWAWGDVYKLQATHYSPVTQTTYVSAYNECRITPRI